MTPSWVAAGLVAVLVGLLVPVRSAGPTEAQRRRVPWSAVLVAAVTSLALTASWVRPTTSALALVLGLTALGIAGAVRRRRAAVRAERRSDRVLAACEALASDLGVGQPPLRCLERLAVEWPELAPVAAAGRMGADVPAVLRSLAEHPGAGQLRTLAASWAVAHRTGAGLARSVDRAADSIRADRRTARLVGTELASARATARMLAALPVGVLLLGTGIGGDPVGFLVGTPAGVACLGAGLGLSLAGLRWLEAIADRVLRP